MYRNLIIDTDPGVDDALAICYLISKDLPILAISTVYGNSTLENCTINASKILNWNNKNSIPLYVGSPRPIKGKIISANSQGNNGLWRDEDAQLKFKSSSFSDLLDLIRSQKEKIDILAIGPLTNIAKIISSDNFVRNRINNVVIMAGSIGEPGNTSKGGEFNAANDPVALKQVLECKLKTILIPANVCRKYPLSLSDVKDIAKSKEMTKAISMYEYYYRNNSNFGGYNGMIAYDLIAALYILNPSLFKLEKKDVDVDLKTGNTLEKQTYDNNNYIAVDLNFNLFV